MPTPREFLSSAKGIVALVFSILGAVFALVGLVIAIGALGSRVAGAPGAVGLGLGAGGFAFLSLGLVLGGIGVGLGLRRRAELRARAELRERGMPCDGVVDDVRQNLRVRVNRRHPWVVRYRYSAGGQQHEGSETMMDLPSDLKQGDRVAVVYDRANPRRSALKNV